MARELYQDRNGSWTWMETRRGRWRTRTRRGLTRARCKFSDRRISVRAPALAGDKAYRTPDAYDRLAVRCVRVLSARVVDKGDRGNISAAGEPDPPASAGGARKGRARFPNRGLLTVMIETLGWPAVRESLADKLEARIR